MTSVEMDVMSAIANNNPSPQQQQQRASKREREKERKPDKESAESTTQPPQQAVYWARVKGFSPWPARLCSALEAHDLDKKTPLAKRERETKSVAKRVMFFGNKRTMGVSFDSAMSRFLASTFEARVEKGKLRSDAEYRAAVAEAMLLVEGQGEVFEGENALLMQDELNALKALPLSERCHSCHGTNRSGDMQQCVICERHAIHWSCFRFEDKDVANKQWVCPQCREEEGLPRDYIESSVSPSLDSEIEVPTHAQSQSGKEKETRPRSSLLSHALSVAERERDSDVDETPTDPQIYASMDPKERKRERERERRRRNRERELREKAERERERRRARALERERERETPSHSLTHTERDAERDRERVTRASLASTALPSDDESDGESDSHTRTRIHKDTHTNTQSLTADNGDGGESESESEDFCFVCGQGSEVLCCDFPGCRKVYHQMCVVKTLPLPLRMIDKDESGDNYDHNSVFRSFYHHQSTRGARTQDTHTHAHAQGEDDGGAFVWFCPRHYCTSCSALETLSCNWQFTPLPSHLYAQLAHTARTGSNAGTDNAHSSQTLRMKSVTSCTKCPLSLCVDCDRNIQHAWGCSVFGKSKRTSSLGPQTCVCLNCASPSPRQRLAKVLEGAWARMSRSRLATPFLRPSLPVAVNRHAYSRRNSHAQIHTETQHSFTPIHAHTDALTYQTHTNGHVLSPPHNMFPQTVCRSHALSPQAHLTHLSPRDETQLDLLSLCERIHDLRYTSRKDFLNDLNALRNTVVARLNHFLTEDMKKRSFDGNLPEKMLKSVDQHPTYQDLIFAVNTIVEAAHAHLETQAPLLYEIERAVCESARETQTNREREKQSTQTQSTITSAESVSDGEAAENKKRRRTSTRLSLAQSHTDPSEQTHTQTHTQSSHTHTEAEAQLRRVLWRLPVHRRTSLSESERERLGETVCVSDALLSHSYVQTQCAYDNFSVAMTGSHTLIAPRSLHAWAEFVRRGVMPANAIAPDTYSRAPSPADSLSCTDLCSEERVKDAFAEALGHNKGNDVQSIVADELLAAEMMMSMQRRALNETVSLPFPRSSSAYPSSFALSSAADRESVDVTEDDLSHTRCLGVRELQSPKEDETLLMLQRLQQLTRQTLDLQARLQREYTQRQRRVLIGSETLSLSEAGLVRELVLANEHLRWRLSQEQRQTQQQSREKTDLQALIKTQQEKIEALERKR